MAFDAWRVVEAQHLVSTRKLVDSDPEQALLEELIDGVKPPAPSGQRHYLLFTPFRYPPLRHGSRFGSAAERGIWYGSEAVPVALAESAYYRLLFREGTTAALGPIRVDVTAFQVRMRTKSGVDLTRPPFASLREDISSATRHDASQSLGAHMRTNGVELFLFVSARDPHGGTNVGAFTPSVFGRAKPRNLETWHTLATPDAVEFRKRDYFERIVVRFERAQFLVDGELPDPAT